MASADIHAHNFKEFDNISDKSGSQRLDNIVDTLGAMQDFCVSTNIPVLLIAGDLFNIRGKIVTIVYNAIYTKIKEICSKGINVIILSGNHDESGNGEDIVSSLHGLQDIPNVQIVESLSTIYVTHDEEVVRIVCVPYMKNTEKVINYINSIEPEDTPTVLMAHLGVTGGFVGSNNYPLSEAFSPKDLRPDFFKYVILGHFHKRQIFSGYPNMFYCGAPIQHSFNDEGEDKGVYVLDTRKRCDVKFVPIENPKFHTVSGDISIEELREHCSIGNYLRIQLMEKDLQEFKKKVPEGLKYKIDIVKEYKSVVPVDIQVGMTFEQIITKYAEEHNPEYKSLGLQILQEVMEE